MKHKLICLILCLLLLPSLFLSVGAEQQYVIDNADLMSSSEEAALEEKAQALRQKYGMDVVILTVDSLDGKRPRSTPTITTITTATQMMACCSSCPWKSGTGTFPQRETPSTL